MHGHSDELVEPERCHMINTLRVLIPCIGMRGHPHVHRVDDIVYAVHEPLEHHKNKKPVVLKLDVYR